MLFDDKTDLIIFANKRLMSFSKVPLTPIAPGSFPPWPGSITTIKFFFIFSFSF